MAPITNPESTKKRSTPAQLSMVSRRMTASEIVRSAECHPGNAANIQWNERTRTIAMPRTPSNAGTLACVLTNAPAKVLSLCRTVASIATTRFSPLQMESSTPRRSVSRSPPHAREHFWNSLPNLLPNSEARGRIGREEVIPLRRIVRIIHTGRPASCRRNQINRQVGSTHILYRDYETRSTLKVKSAGAWKYAATLTPKSPVARTRSTMVR